MPMKCSVCSHAQRPEIDQALVLGQASIRAIARQFGATKDSLARHRAHIPAALLKAKEAAEVAQADSLLGDVQTARDRGERLYATAEGILERALAAQDLKVALAAIRSAIDVMGEARAYLELKGRITGELAAAEQPRLPNVTLVVPVPVPPGSTPLALPVRPVQAADVIDVAASGS